MKDDFNDFHRDNSIYSRFTDYYKMSRYVVLIASTFSLLGHCTLIMFRSEYGILLGKIFIGFGMSCDGSILGQVGRKDWEYSDSPAMRVVHRGRSFPIHRSLQQGDLVRLHPVLLFVNSA